jgi:hypothetical protein
MHSNQSWVFSSAGRNISPAHAAGLSPAPPFFSCGLEHQPCPRGWAESSLVVAGWNISLVHAAGLSPAQLTEGWNISLVFKKNKKKLLFSCIRPSLSKQKNHIVFLYNKEN